jgi:methylmalonyl-CoA mutase
LARNTQIVLKAESSLDRVVDPAGGSYYVEALTESLAQAAWKVLQDVEAAGGYTKACENGLFANEIKKSRDAKETAVASRRRSILGTNQYPNLKERMLPQIKVNTEEGSPRAAQVFERIRLRTERSGKAPLFLLAEYGDLKMRKARSGFSLNFFGCAGFEVKNAVCASAGEIVKTAIERNAAAVVLCSSDDEYAKIAGPVVGGLKAAGKDIPVIVAGNPKDAEQLKQDGVADFIHVRTNAAQTLSAWQQKLGVKE